MMLNVSVATFCLGMSIFVTGILITIIAIFRSHDEDAHKIKGFKIALIGVAAIAVSTATIVLNNVVLLNV
jgi:hypothetical protein